MNMNMTMILLTLSLVCNLWFAFLLLYDQIVETRFVRFLISMVKLWKSLDAGKTEGGTGNKRPSAEPVDVIGKSHYKMASTRTMTAIPTQEAATLEKAIELSEDDTTFAEEKAEKRFRNAQVPNEKLEAMFTHIPHSELKYNEDEPEEETPQASGNSFNEIDDACKTANNPKATARDKENAVKVFTQLEGTELYDILMKGSTEMSIQIRELIELSVKRHKTKKEFVIPDNIEDFNISDYCD